MEWSGGSFHQIFSPPSHLFAPFIGSIAEREENHFAPLLIPTWLPLDHREFRSTALQWISISDAAVWHSSRLILKLRADSQTHWHLASCPPKGRMLWDDISRALCSARVTVRFTHVLHHTMNEEERDADSIYSINMFWYRIRIVPSLKGCHPMSDRGNHLILCHKS